MLKLAFASAPTLGLVVIGGLRIRKQQAAPARKAPTQAGNEPPDDDDIPF